MVIKDRSIYLIGLLFALIGLIPQFTGYINLDDAWLLDVAGRVVHGEKLGTQVVESNPPLVVYIMELPVYLADLLHIGHVSGFIIFIALLSTISLALTFSKVQDGSLRLCMFFLIFILPGVIFGEREHIFIILFMPYFVSLWRQEKVSLRFAIITGLMAGLGIALKPFFVIIWVVVVITRMVLDKRFFAFWNVQDMLITVIGLSYAFYVVCIEQTYYGQVFPLMVKYYGAFGTDTKAAVKQAVRLIVLFQLPFWIIFIKDRTLLNRPLYLLNFANLVSIITLVIQSKTWMNYFYPSHFFGFLENIWIISVVFTNSKELWNKVAAAIASIVIVVFVGYAIAATIKVALRLGESDTTKLINIFDEYAKGKNVAVLSFDLGVIYPAVDYSEAHYEGRYGHLWMLPGMYIHAKKDGERIIFNRPEERSFDESKIISIIATELSVYKPEIVVVVESRYYDHRLGKFDFNLIDYFSMDQEFKNTWKNYEKIKTIGTMVIYRYKHK